MAADPPKNPPRTVFMPNPGGKLPEAPAPQADPFADPFAQPAADPFGIEAQAAAPTTGAIGATGEARHGINPMIDAASDLFELVVYLRSQRTPPQSVDQLRASAADLINVFEGRALAAGRHPKMVKAARYALSATIDDAVLASPWGIDQGWGRRPLVSDVDQTVDGGEGFFRLLKQAKDAPDRLGELLEFMYVCLSLGFMGRYRAEAGGAAKLDAVRQSVFTTIQNRRTGPEALALSPRWQGVSAGRTPIREIVPLWLAASVAVLAIGGLFLLFRGAANADVREARAAVAAMGFGTPVTIVGAEPDDTPPPLVVPGPVVDQVVLNKVCTDLAAERQAGLVECTGDPGFVTVRIVGDEMFGSGRATLKGGVRETIRTVGSALAPFVADDVRIDVLGYTDSVPVRRGSAYADNYDLSGARAQAVANILDDVVSDRSRLRVEGRGDESLILDETGQENMARSRRVELRLVKE